MGRPHWADEVAYPFLCAKADLYKSIKGSKKPKDISNFFNTLYEEWDVLCPNLKLTDVVGPAPVANTNGTDGVGPEPVANTNGTDGVGPESVTNTNGTDGVGSEPVADKKKKKKRRRPLTIKTRINDFINNHTRPVAGEGRQKLLILVEKKTKWQDWQAYSHKYWPIKLKTVVHAEWLEHVNSLEGAISSETYFKFQHRRVQELLAEETDEVKAEVREMAKKKPTLAEEAALEQLTSEGFSEDEAREERRKSKLKALPQTVLATMEGIAQQCGMVSLILLGGVDPENPQTVQTMVFQHGETAGGRSFEESHRDFIASVKVPFTTFAHKVLVVDKSLQSGALQSKKECSPSVTPSAATSRSTSVMPSTATTAATSRSSSVTPSADTTSCFPAVTPPAATTATTSRSPLVTPSAATAVTTLAAVEQPSPTATTLVAAGRDVAASVAGVSPVDPATLDFAWMAKDLPPSSPLTQLLHLADEELSGGSNQASVLTPGEERVSGDMEMDMNIDPYLRGITGRVGTAPSSTTLTSPAAVVEPIHKPSSDTASSMDLRLGQVGDAAPPQNFDRDVEMSDNDANLVSRGDGVSNTSEADDEGQNAAKTLMEQLGISQFTDDISSGTKWGQTTSARKAADKRGIDTKRGGKVASNRSLRSKGNALSTPIPPIPKPQSTLSPNSANNIPATYAVSSAPSLDLPEAWVIELREVLDTQFEHVGYKATVELWVEFEQLIEVQGKKKTRLAASERPPALKAWLQLPRKLSRPPPLGKLAAYSSMWNAWWRVLQPAWRVETAGRLSLRKVPEETWRELMKGGEDGFSFLLLSLAWWIEQATSKSQRAECVRALKDVSWVLEQLVAKLREDAGEDEAGEDDAGRYQKRRRTFE